MRPIDADALKEKLHNISFSGMGGYKANKAVDEMPTIDVVKVVRCKNCKSYGESPFGHHTIGWCMIAGSHRKPDYYCASGEEKENATNRC